MTGDSHAHRPKHTSMHVNVCAFSCDFFVYGCVSSGVRQIVASEPGGERRRAITHGGGVGLSN